MWRVQLPSVTQMKFYIAATLSDLIQAKRVIGIVEKRGHSVLVDWTKDTKLETPYSKQKKKKRDLGLIEI